MSELIPDLVVEARDAGRLLRPEEVAEALGVTRRRLYRLVDDGRLRAVRVGRSIRFHPTAVVELLDAGGEAER